MRLLEAEAGEKLDTNTMTRSLCGCVGFSTEEGRGAPKSRSSHAEEFWLAREKMSTPNAMTFKLLVEKKQLICVKPGTGWCSWTPSIRITSLS